MMILPSTLAMLHTHHFALHFFPPSSPLQHRPLKFRRSSLAFAFRPQLAELSDELSPATPIEETEGPIKIPSFSSSSSLFSTDDNPTPLQTATSVLLTGAITVFLFRFLRKRARRAKELRVRSTGTKKVKDVKEEALDRLKVIGVGPVEAEGSPSPVQVLLGGVAAGVIAVILYKFTTTVEAALNRQAIPDNFSVRQLTITIRTIVNGLCYLATFVFGINSIGLILYSVQLAFGSVMEGRSNNSSSIKNEVENTDVQDPSKTSTDESDSRNEGMAENADET